MLFNGCLIFRAMNLVNFQGLPRYSVAVNTLDYMPLHSSALKQKCDHVTKKNGQIHHHSRIF